MKRIVLAVAITVISDPISTEAYLQIRNVAVRYIPKAPEADQPSACVWTQFHKTKCEQVKLAGINT